MGGGRTLALACAAAVLLALGVVVNTEKQLKHPAFTTSLTLKVLYWRVFEQYAHILQEDLPNLKVEGETYPPPRIYEILSNIVFAIRMGCILLLLAGPGALEAIGIRNPPGIYLWAQENKLTALLILMLLGSQIEGQLLSTGAFEVYLNGNPVWSKLETGRLPSMDDLRLLIEDPLMVKTDAGAEPGSEQGPTIISLPS